jgi:hypothetical protein
VITESRVRSIGGGKKNIGVEKDYVHTLDLGGLVVWDGGRIEAHLADFLFGASIVLCVHGIREEKLCPTFRCIDFYWHGYSGMDQHAVFPLLRNHKGTLLYTKAAA